MDEAISATPKLRRDKMKVQTKLNVPGHKAWSVLVNGVVKFDNLTIHEAEQIAKNIREDIKNGVYTE